MRCNNIRVAKMALFLVGQHCQRADPDQVWRESAGGPWKHIRVPGHCPPSSPPASFPPPGPCWAFALGSDFWPRTSQPLGSSRGVSLLPKKAHAPAQASLTSESRRPPLQQLLWAVPGDLCLLRAGRQARSGGDHDAPADAGPEQSTGCQGIPIPCQEAHVLSAIILISFLII